MRSALLLMLVGSLMAADPGLGDEVRVLTSDGRDLVGMLLSQPDAKPLRLRVTQGDLRAEVTIPQDLVLQCSVVLTAGQQRLKAIQEETALAGEASTAEQHWQWARECRSLGDAIAWREHLRLCLERDPEHELAHRALDHVRHEDRWMSQAEAMRAMGLVRHDGAWMTPQEMAAREEAERLRREEAARAREQLLARLAASRDRNEPPTTTTIVMSNSWGPSWGGRPWIGPVWTSAGCRPTPRPPVLVPRIPFFPWFPLLQTESTTSLIIR